MTNQHLNASALQQVQPQCLGYARVSTQNQKLDGLSIDVQKTKILEKVEEINGALVEDIFVDNGRSGTNMDRAGLNNLLARCSKGDISHLVIQDTSRIARNEKDHLVIRALLRKYNIKLLALTGFQASGNDPYADFIDLIMAGVNALHPRISGFKARQTAIEKFKFGIYPSWACLGYKNSKNSNPTNRYDQRIVIPDPQIAPFITQAFKMYATRDHSIFSIRMYLHKNGVRGKSGRSLSYSVIHNTLKNPFYHGLMRWGGLENKGKHRLLTDKGTFDLVQKILSEKGMYNIRKRKHNFLLRSFIFCKNCGRRYTAEWHFNKEKLKHCGGKIAYYHCSQVGKRGKCKSKYVQLEDLEDQVEKQIAKLEFKPEFIEAVKNNIRKVYEQTNKRVKLAKKAVYNRKTAIEIKREKLEEELLAGIIIRERFKALNAKIDAELLDIQKELADINKIRTIDIKIIDEVLALTQNIVKAYKNADVNAKRAYLRFFFQKIWVKNKKITGVEYQPVIEVLNQASLGIISSNWLPLKDLFRNHKLEFDFTLNHIQTVFDTLGLEPAIATA